MASILSLKKVPIHKLSVTFSNLNRFSKFLRSWKAYEICYKTSTAIPTSPYRHVATLPWEIKNSNFLRYSAHVEENANKLHFKCTDFNSYMHVTVYADCIYVFLSKSCSRHSIPCWLLTNTAVTSDVTNFWCHKLIVKVNK